MTLPPRFYHCTCGKLHAAAAPITFPTRCPQCGVRLGYYGPIPDRDTK